MSDLVPLTTSSGPYQKTIIEEILRSEGIPFETRERGAAAYLGASSPLIYEEIVVPSDRLQAAKDILCAHGVVCEVSERLLNRSLEEIVRPLLGQKERDLSRLVRFVDINNKETVRALFEATLKETGGLELLEDLFFSLAREDAQHRRVLARVLQRKMNAAFAERFHMEATLGQKKTRLALLEALPDLPSSAERSRILVACLRDRDGEIREAASEALFTLHGDEHGYDPEDPPAEREAAVQRILAKAGL
jgi:hypothetical protein